MSDKKWKKISSKKEKVGHRVIISKRFIMPDGSEQEYTTLGRENGNCIATIAITKDKKVIVARQFRTGPELVFDELPGGGADYNEDVEIAARRELREETGYETNGLFKHLGTIYKDAYTNEAHHYFLALNCEKTNEQELDETEHIEIALISIEQLISNAKTTKMSDSAAVLMAYKDLEAIQHETSH